MTFILLKSLGKPAMVITYGLLPGLRHSALEDVKEVLENIGSEFCESLLLDADKDAYSVLFNSEPVEGVPCVAFPTKTGIGSELTCWAAATREDMGVRSCSHSSRIL